MCLVYQQQLSYAGAHWCPKMPNFPCNGKTLWGHSWSNPCVGCSCMIWAYNIFCASMNSRLRRPPSVRLIGLGAPQPSPAPPIQPRQFLIKTWLVHRPMGEEGSQGNGCHPPTHTTTTIWVKYQKSRQIPKQSLGEPSCMPAQSFEKMLKLKIFNWQIANGRVVCERDQAKLGSRGEV